MQSRPLSACTECWTQCSECLMPAVQRGSAAAQQAQRPPSCRLAPAPTTPAGCPLAPPSAFTALPRANRPCACALRRCYRAAWRSTAGGWQRGGGCDARQTRARAAALVAACFTGPNDASLPSSPSWQVPLPVHGGHPTAGHARARAPRPPVLPRAAPSGGSRRLVEFGGCSHARREWWRRPAAGAAGAAVGPLAGGRLLVQHGHLGGLQAGLHVTT